VFGWSAGGTEPQPSFPPGAEREAHRFSDAYLKRFARVPEPYAAQGYEAMAVVLDSIRRAGGGGDNRADVIDAFFATRNRHSPIGTYSIEADGDTSLKAVAGLRIQNGRAFLERALQGR
jgi:branched-chain amino acid transport system substrate-binding protein